MAKLYYVRAYSHKDNMHSRWHVTANSGATAAWRVGQELPDHYKVVHVRELCDAGETQMLEEAP